MPRRHDDDPILITEAAPSYDDEFKARKKRYSIIMACRIPCLVLAGVFAIAFHLTLVPLLLIVLSVPLPWVAVLIANDRLPQKSGTVSKYQHRARQLADTDRRVIEAAEVLDARDAPPASPSSDAQDDPRADRGGHAGDGHPGSGDADPGTRRAG